MDFQFWITLAVNIAGLYLTYRASPRKGAPVSNTASLRAALGRYWYVLAMIPLVAITWAPYVLVRLDRAQTVNIENVETFVREWCDNFGFGTRRVTDQIDNKDARFALLLSLQNGKTVLVGQTESLNRYLTIQSKLILSPEHSRAFEALSEPQRAAVLDDVTVELGRAKTPYSIELPMKSIEVMKRLPITNGLTEDAFIRAIEDVEASREAVRGALVISLRTHSVKAHTAR